MKPVAFLGPGIHFGITRVVVRESKEISFPAKAYKADWPNKVSVYELEGSCDAFLRLVLIVDFGGLGALTAIADMSRQVVQEIDV